MSAFATAPRPSLVPSCDTQDAAESSQRPAPERRRSGRRARARDRLFDRATKPQAPSPKLQTLRNVENLLLFVDDDLRETTLALTRIEAYLTRTLCVLEAREPQREEVQALVNDREVLDHVDLLNETLESLRRRLARLSASMK